MLNSKNASLTIRLNKANALEYLKLILKKFNLMKCTLHLVVFVSCTLSVKSETFMLFASVFVGFSV